MRDLKHLIYFEDLLQEAHNELVRKAREDGKLALGYTCYFMPEVLLDLPGCFSVRLRAPRCSSARVMPSGCPSVSSRLPSDLYALAR